MDAVGNLFIADRNNRRVRKVSSSGLITTVAGDGGFGFAGDGGPATDADFRSVRAIFVTASGDIFIADDSDQRIRKVDGSTGIITTVAGNGASGFTGDGGPATDASLNFPSDIYVNASGELFIVQGSNNRIRKVDTSGTITTFAGNGESFPFVDGGAATDATLSSPRGIFGDAGGNIYIVESGRVRRVDSAGIITTIAGTGSSGFGGDGLPATDAQFDFANGVFVNPQGDVFVADENNHRIRQILALPNVIALSATPASVTAGGLGSVIQAEIRDRSGNLQTGDNTTVVNFRVADGQGELSVIQATVSGGVATTTVRTEEVGTVIVQAKSSTAEGTSIAVSATDATQRVTLTTTPTSIPDDGSVTAALEARLEDLNGNLQSGDNSTVISFRIMGSQVSDGEGTLGATEVTVSGGIATTTLTGMLPGGLDVDAGAPGALSDMVTVTVVSATTGGGGPPLPTEVGPGDIGTIAGGGTGDGNLATNAFLSTPERITLDAAGNIYIVDQHNFRVRRVDVSTGIITTVAGSGGRGVSGDGGPATDAELDFPRGVFVDSGGNLFIADHNNGRIRKVTPGGTISTVAGEGSDEGDGGPATSARLNGSAAVTGDASGNLFILETSSPRIRKVDSAGIITTVAGDGSFGSGGQGDGGAATDAAFNFPSDVVVDGSGNLFIADSNDRRVRKVDGSTGIITTFAGTGSSSSSGDGGQATDAGLNPARLFLDGSGNLFIGGGSRVRRVDASGIITTVAGTGSSSPPLGDGGPATSASLSSITGITGDSAGNLFITDQTRNRIRKIDTSGIITTVAGGSVLDGGPATDAGLGEPQDITQDGAGNLFIADTFNHRIRKVDNDGTITTVVGDGFADFSGDGGIASEATLNHPSSVFVDAVGNLFIADQNNRRIRKVSPSGLITTVAGNGNSNFAGDGVPATETGFNFPHAVFVDNQLPFTQAQVQAQGDVGAEAVVPPGNIYIADQFGYRVHKVDGSTGIITTVAGNGTSGFSGDGGPATDANLGRPHDIFGLFAVSRG